jgi:hypothetical protein
MAMIIPFLRDDRSRHAIGYEAKGERTNLADGQYKV